MGPPGLGKNLGMTRYKESHTRCTLIHSFWMFCSASRCRGCASMMLSSLKPAHLHHHNHFVLLPPPLVCLPCPSATSRICNSAAPSARSHRSVAGWAQNPAEPSASQPPSASTPSKPSDDDNEEVGVLCNCDCLSTDPGRQILIQASAIRIPCAQFEGLLPEEDAQVPGGYEEAVNGNTRLGKAVRAACTEIKHLNELVSPRNLRQSLLHAHHFDHLSADDETSHYVQCRGGAGCLPSKHEPTQ
jgi:hypothetical protein